MPNTLVNKHYNQNAEIGRIYFLNYPIICHLKETLQIQKYKQDENKRMDTIQTITRIRIGVAILMSTNIRQNRLQDKTCYYIESRTFCNNKRVSSNGKHMIINTYVPNNKAAKY